MKNSVIDALATAWAIFKDGWYAFHRATRKYQMGE